MSQADEYEDQPENILRIVMPSKGDMKLINQEGGEIDLEPIFYGVESMGPHFQVVQGERDDKGKFVVQEVIGRYKLKLKKDGRLELKKAQ